MTVTTVTILRCDGLPGCEYRARPLLLSKRDAPLPDGWTRSKNGTHLCPRCPMITSMIPWVQAERGGRKYVLPEPEPAPTASTDDPRCGDCGHLCEWHDGVCGGIRVETVDEGHVTTNCECTLIFLSEDQRRDAAVLPRGMDRCSCHHWRARHDRFGCMTADCNCATFTRA